MQFVVPCHNDDKGGDQHPQHENLKQVGQHHHFGSISQNTGPGEGSTQLHVVGQHHHFGSISQNTGPGEGSTQLHVVGQHHHFGSISRNTGPGEGLTQLHVVGQHHHFDSILQTQDRGRDKHVGCLVQVSCAAFVSP